MEKVRNRTKVGFIRTHGNDKIIEQQTKLTFEKTDKSYTIYESYTIKQNEVLTDKLIYPRHAILDLSKLLMYETYYDI